MEGFVAQDLVQQRRQVTLNVFDFTGITELTHTHTHTELCLALLVTLTEVFRRFTQR
jgi:hypothetical protein